MTSVKPLLIALGCALLLVFTEQVTRQTIAENTVYFETKLLREMVPNADIVETQKNLWMATQNEEHIATIAAIESNEGYNGKIALLVAWSNTGSVLNIRTTYHRETPGLGDIIDHTASNWLDTFIGRSINKTRWALKDEGDIDGVTGATITARATTRAVARLFEEIAGQTNSTTDEVSP